MQRADCMVNAQDNSGNTPLHVACNSLNEPIIRSIKISNKADFGILNNDHKKAADVLKYKAKQAGQLTKFNDIAEELGAGSAEESKTEPQE